MLRTFENADCGLHGALTAPIVSLGDSSPHAGHMTGLLPCDDWDKAEYLLPTCIYDVAVNVEVTGRKPRFFSGTAWMRARITFVGEGEPDEQVKGWARV